MTDSNAYPIDLSRPQGFLLEPSRLGLVTDLYELTMAAGYWSMGMAERRATFELVARELPAQRNYLVAAGLEQALHYLLNLRFTAEDLAYLRTLAVFARMPDAWYESLALLRFRGNVWAIALRRSLFRSVRRSRAD